MTNEERIDALVTRLKEKLPQVAEHEDHMRLALRKVVDMLQQQDLKKPGAYTPTQYLDAIEANLSMLAQFTP